MKKLILLSVTVCFLLLQGNTQSQRVTIPGSELRKIQSTIVDQEYELHIYLPGSYANSTKTYPVIYLMDSQWDFGLVSAIYGEQYYDGFIPEIIIIGVAWGGVNPKPDSLRFRDYSPSKVSWAPHTGGAAKFLSFMKEELFPFIETNYRADKAKRGLMGCSLGGLFTLYALFTEPELFQHYVAASPAVEWDNEVIYKYEKAYSEKKSNAPARLYMTVGEVEKGVPGFNKFEKQLAARNYKAIQFKARILENTGHSGTKAETYARGLQYIFERPSLSLENAILNKYAGNYQPGTIAPSITIMNENKQLALYFGADKYVLYAINETDFYSNNQFLNIRFKISNGKVDGFQFETFGNSQFITKKE